MSCVKNKIIGTGLIIFLVFLAAGFAYSKTQTPYPFDEQTRDAMGVCPPFYLLDKKGEIINPVIGINADKPYSPKQTCGKCHNYDKITSGYHFQQGRGEMVSDKFRQRYPWVTSPAQYGGRW